MPLSSGASRVANGAILAGYSLCAPYAPDARRFIDNLRRGERLQASRWFGNDELARGCGLKKDVSAARLTHGLASDSQLIRQLIDDALAQAGLEKHVLSGERVRVYLTGLGPRIDALNYRYFYDSNSMEDLEINKSIARLDASTISQDGLARRIAEEYNLSLLPPCLFSSSNSSLASVHLGVQAIASGEIDWVLVVNGSTIKTQDLVYLDSQSMLDGEYCQPFGEESQCVLPSEGFATVLLERSGHRTARGGGGGVRLTSGYSQISAGRTNNASQLASSMLRLMHDTLSKAQVAVDALCGVIPHANGSLSDKAEAQALSSLLGGTDVPLMAYKGQIGYIITGSGIIDMVIGYHCLTQGEIPTPVGDENILKNISRHLLLNKGVIRHDKKHLLKTGISVDGSIICLAMSLER